MQRNMEFLEQREQELMPVEAKMRHTCHKPQSLQDKHLQCEGQIQKLRSRDHVLHQSIRDAQKAVHDAQEELHGHAHKASDIEKEMQAVQDDIRRVENTNEESRASDASSVQQSSANTSCNLRLRAEVEKELVVVSDLSIQRGFHVYWFSPLTLITQTFN